MKPVIVMTAGHGQSSHDLQQAELCLNYAEAISAAGGLPLLAPDADEQSAVQLTAACDALFLTGGKDVDPGCYGQERLPECGTADPRRDKLELLLGRAFLQAKKPILGVCRGFQMLNVLFGGTLYQDIPSQVGIAHPYNSVHTVRALSGSPLEKLFGTEFTVNSLHHQALRELGSGLVAAAFSEDGKIVEAFMHETLPVFATQFHPERMTGAYRWSPEGPDMAPLFRYFLSLCKK